MKILAKMGQFKVIFMVWAAILGVHNGHKLDQGHK